MVAPVQPAEDDDLDGDANEGRPGERDGEPRRNDPVAAKAAAAT